MYLVAEVTDAVAYGFNIFLGAVEFHRNDHGSVLPQLNWKWISRKHENPLLRVGWFGEFRTFESYRRANATRSMRQ
jgi:hypothetical protein